MDIVFDKKIYIYVEDTYNGILNVISQIYNNQNPFNAGTNLIDTIVTGSSVLDEMIVDTKIEFGVFYASKFETTLYNVSDLSGKYIHVFEEDIQSIEDPIPAGASVNLITEDDNLLLTEDGEELYTEGIIYQQTDTKVISYHPVFTGRVDSCKRDKLNDDRKLVAYDPAYTIGQQDVSEWYETFFEQHKEDDVTLKQTRESLITYLGLNNPTDSFINDSIIVEKTISLDSGSASAMIKMLCELSCVFPHFDRKGKLEFIQLGNAEFDLTNKYEWSTSEFEEYVTDTITGVQFTDSDNEEKQIVGQYGNMYLIQKNIFLYSAGAERLNTVGTNILNYIKTITFTPADMNVIVGSLSYQVGNKITTPEGNFYVFANQLSGPLFVNQELVARGDKQISNITGVIDWLGAVFNEKYAKIRKDVDMYQQIYGDRLTGLESEFRQTADNILLQVSNLQTGVSSAIDVSNEAVRIASIGPKSSAEIITMINQNGDSQIKINADQIDIEGNATFRNIIDNSVTQIMGGNLITEVIYAREGEYSNITVDQLKTSRRIKRYLTQDDSDNNYLHIHDNTIEFVFEQIASGSPSRGLPPVQATNSFGDNLYWVESISNADIVNGMPQINGIQVMITTTETEYPVMVYNYDEPVVKASFAFDQPPASEPSAAEIPFITLGEGDGNGNGVAKIYNRYAGLQIEYSARYLQRKCCVRLTDDGVQLQADEDGDFIEINPSNFRVIVDNDNETVGMELRNPTSNLSTGPELNLLKGTGNDTVRYKVSPVIAVEEDPNDDYSDAAAGAPTGTIIAVLEEEI